MTFMTSDGWIGAVLLPKPCRGILHEKSYIHEGEREKEKEKKPRVRLKVTGVLGLLVLEKAPVAIGLLLNGVNSIVLLKLQVYQLHIMSTY